MLTFTLRGVGVTGAEEYRGSNIKFKKTLSSLLMYREKRNSIYK